jgi:hypothetical protein
MNRPFKKRTIKFSVPSINRKFGLLFYNGKDVKRDFKWILSIQICEFEDEVEKKRFLLIASFR